MRWHNQQDSFHVHELRLGFMISAYWGEAYRLFKVFLDKIFHRFVVPHVFIDTVHFIQLLEFGS